MILAVEKLETIPWRVGFLNCLSYQISDALTCLSVFGVRFNDYGATHSQGTYGVGSYDGYGKGEVAGTNEVKQQEDENEKITDRRTAAYALAIRKIAEIYESMYL